MASKKETISDELVDNEKLGAEQVVSFVDNTVLTIGSSPVAENNKEDLLWHEVQNAYRSKKILTGTLNGIERMDAGISIAILNYKGFRVVVPVAEMMIDLEEREGKDYGDLLTRQNKIINRMLGCEIDFVIKGLDRTEKSIVASRKEAMLRKRQSFFIPQGTRNPLIVEGKIAEARVVAVSDKVVRVEVFGVETSIPARDLTWDWLGDAHEKYTVGDVITVRVNKISGTAPEDIMIQADVKSTMKNNVLENLKKCRTQCQYCATVTDIYKGTMFLRLDIGVNGIAHTCYDSRLPGKGDVVSFVVTKKDEERFVAVGLISRIIKQGGF